MNPSGHWIIPRDAACVGRHNGFWKPFLLLCLVHARGTFTGSKLPRGPCNCRKGDTWHQTASLLSKLGSRYVIEPHRIDLRLGICLFVTYKQLVPPCLRRKQMRCTSIWNNTATKGMWLRPLLGVWWLWAPSPSILIGEYSLLRDQSSTTGTGTICHSIQTMNTHFTLASHTVLMCEWHAKGFGWYDGDVNQEPSWLLGVGTLSLQILCT